MLFRTFIKPLFVRNIKLNHKLVRKTYKNMFEYDRIDISEGTDIKKYKEISRECSLCKFYYFLDKNFNHGPYFCNGCYDMSMKAASMQNLAIINHNGNHYRVNFAFMSEKDAYNLIKNAVIIDKKRTLQVS